jgi:hypothetical protein
MCSMITGICLEVKELRIMCSQGQLSRVQLVACNLSIIYLLLK